MSNCGCDKSSKIELEWGVGGTVQRGGVWEGYLTVLPLDEAAGPYLDHSRFGLDAEEGDTAPTQVAGTFCSLAQRFTAASLTSISLDTIDLRYADEYAFSFWVRPEETKREQTVLSSFLRLYLTYLNEPGVQLTGVNDEGVTQSRSFEATSKLTKGAWAHVGYVFDATTVRIYINGVLNRTATHTLTLEKLAASSLLGGDGAVNTYLSASLMDLRVHMVGRNAEYMAATYQNVCSDAFYLWGNQSYASPD